MTQDQLQQKTQKIEDDEINLLEYWQVIYNHRRLIGYIVAGIVVATVIVSLLLTNIYQGRAVIMPVSSQKEGQGTSSLGAMMAQQVGIMPPSGVQGAEIVNLLKSNIVREKFINSNNLLPVLFEESWDAEKQDWKRGGIKLNPLFWIGKGIGAVTGFIHEKPASLKKDTDVPDIWDGLRKIEDIVKVKHNIKENIITVTVDFKDPQIAATMTSQLLTTLVDHMSDEAKRVAKTNKDYLEDQLAKNTDPFIKQKIYALIATQIETIMMAEIKENFAFKIIDPPKVPDRKIKPKRALMVVLSLVVGLFLAVFVVFFMEYLKKIKARSSGVN